MKIVQILYSGLGGHGSVAFSLAGAAKKSCSWKSRFLFVGIEPLLPEYVRTCREEGSPCSYVNVTAGRSWQSWFRIFKHLAQVRPDAIILHSVKTILPCWLYARKHKIPLISVEHQPNDLKKRSEWIVSRLLMVLADEVVTLTPEYRQELEHRLGRYFRKDKVHTISNGIDISTFSSCTEDKFKRVGRVVIGMAARFSSKKRQETLVDALNILRGRHDQIDWRLTLAGDGKTVEAVREKVTKLGLEEFVEMPGYLGQEKLVEWFGTLDIYTHASDGETLSTSLLQALAMGLPIVGSDVPGISNLLTTGGGSGLLVKNGSPEHFSSAFQRLVGEENLAETLSKRARQQAVEEFSQETMFKKYHKILLKHE